jgi:hypothetical protein
LQRISPTLRRHRSHLAAEHTRTAPAAARPVLRSSGARDRVVPLDVLGLSLAEAMAPILLILAGSLLMTSSRSDARMAANEYVATGR